MKLMVFRQFKETPLASCSVTRYLFLCSQPLERHSVTNYQRPSEYLSWFFQDEGVWGSATCTWITILKRDRFFCFRKSREKSKERTGANKQLNSHYKSHPAIHPQGHQGLTSTTPLGGSWERRNPLSSVGQIFCHSLYLPCGWMDLNTPPEQPVYPISVNSYD